MDIVLVIEDSKSMQRVLRRLFESGGLEVQIAPDGAAGLESFEKQRPTAVVLDLKLPDLPGRELCRLFKEDKESIPVVVVSAVTDVRDKVLLLELGADDYVTKPFSAKELLARVLRAIRRQRENLQDIANADLEPAPSGSVAFGDVQVDFTDKKATRAGIPLTLVPPEFELLKVLSHSPGKVLSREQLMIEICGSKPDRDHPATRIVDTCICKLRQKLEPDPTNPQYILTMHGVGYKFKSGW